MEYTKKHKSLIAKLFKKAGMVEEAEFVLSCDKYKYEISKAMCDAASKAKIGIDATLGEHRPIGAGGRAENKSCQKNVR